MSNFELVDFYFNNLEEGPLRDIEEKLLLNPNLLEEYFQLKRELSLDSEEMMAPSTQVKESLFEALFPEQKPIFLWKQWVTPFPIAIAALLILAITLKFVFEDKPINSMPGVQVDMSNNASISLDVL